MCVLYRPNSEHARHVEEYIRDFIYVQPSRKVELIDVDSKEGIAMAELYDIVQYPTIVAIDESGQLQRSWSGELPLSDELAYYTEQQAYLHQMAQ